MYSRQFSNSLPESKAKYLVEAQEAIDTWYRKNAAFLDNNAPGPCPVLTEDQIFQQAMITKKYAVRIAMTPCLTVNGTEVVYRNVAVWIPAFGVQDLAAFTPDGVFQPRNTQVLYKVVLGRGIEAENVSQTQKNMRAIAAALEARFKVKFETDPLRDLSINYFRALDCGAPGPDEIPCSTNIVPTGYVPLTPANFTALRLRDVGGITPEMVNNAWGQPIIFNNVVSDLGNPCVPAPKTSNDPPYTMLLQTLTPWGTTITMCGIQPIN